MAIDLILKSIDYCVKLLERREKGVRDRFDRVYKPLFEALGQINTDYGAMFFAIQRQFPTSIERLEPSYPSEVAEACEKLRELRQSFQSIRDQSAAMAKGIESQTELSGLERQFLNAVLRYLPNGELMESDASNETNRDRTRSTLLLDELYASMTDKDVDVRVLLDSTMSNLRLSWKEVCTAYAHMLTDVK